MKNKYVFTAVMLAVILAAAVGLTTVYMKTAQSAGEDGGGEKTLRVVTSFYPMYVAAENIIGDIGQVSLKNLSEPQTGCLHDFVLTPEDMRLLSGADIFIINGGGIETFLADVARAYPTLTVIDAGEGAAFLDGAPEADTHAGAADEEQMNAHIWMSVAGYRMQVQTIAEALAEAAPEHADTFYGNAARYDARLQELCAEQAAAAARLDGTPVILLHEAYAYIADELGLKSVYLLNLDEERAVSAGEVAEVLNAMEERHALLVLAEERYGRALGELLAAEGGAAVLYLDTLNRGDYDSDSYIDGMRANIRLLGGWAEEH